MPIDINALRADRGGNPVLFRESQAKRFADVDLVDTVLALDESWKIAQSHYETNKMECNTLQKEIATVLKKKEDAKELIASRKVLMSQDTSLKKIADDLKIQVDKVLNKIGNTVHPSVPVSQNEDNNVIVNSWGKCRIQETEEDVDMTLKFHHDLLFRIGGYEAERGVKTAGHRAYFLTRVGVDLEMALMSYAKTFLQQRDFQAVKPPNLMNADNMAQVAQLEEFDEALYKVEGSSVGTSSTDSTLALESEKTKYIIATSEQPMCCYHMGEWIEEASLPLKYAGISRCFRKESGSHGRDTWGIFRVHEVGQSKNFFLKFRVSKLTFLFFVYLV